MMEALTPQQIHILKHSLGLTYTKKSYRNYFNAGPGHADMPDIQALVKLGLMEEFSMNPEIFPGKYFRVTEAGKKWLEELR